MYTLCVEFRLLGPVEVRDGDRVLRAGSERERFVLAVLLLRADRLTPTDSLIEALWSDPPASAKAQLHNMISSLRRRLRGGPDGPIVTRPLGYELRLRSHWLDVLEFGRLAAAGRQALAGGDHQRASVLLAEGLSLWRGPALADIASEYATNVRQALHEERLDAMQAWLDACLVLRRFDEVLAEVAELIASNPYRERLHQLRMLALAGAGRRAEALSVYRQVHRLFADDLGVEPGAPLKELQQRILRGEYPELGEFIVPMPPRQLPSTTPALTGRDKLVAEICGELERPDAAAATIMALVGPGGIGKTTLALAAAHQLESVFPGGHLYADLRGSRDDPVEPHAVAGRFLRALGVPAPHVPDDPEERIAAYRTRLAGSRVLVVLDDASGEAQVRPLLPSGQGCRAVVTSRRQLGALVGAARWTIPVLELADAVKLLSRVVGYDRVAAEPDTAVALVESCGRLPLAVCVAAARLATRPDWTMAEFQTRLEQERRRLDELSVGDLDVRASIGLSYHALSPQARALLRRLGLLAAPDWPAWVPQALLDQPGWATESLLDQLLDVHLVEPLGRDAAGQLRYRLHDLVVAFARERILDEEADHERRDALARVLSGWLALASDVDDRPEWFEAERVCLIAEAEQGCRSGHVGIADLASELTLRLSGFLTTRSLHDDLERIARAATAYAREHLRTELLIRLLGVLFAVCLRRSPTDELIAIAAEERDVATQLGDRHREVSALVNAGWATRKLGRLTQAADWFERAIATAGSDTPSRLVSRALNGLALVHREAGHYPKAVPLTQQALTIERCHGMPRVIAICLVNHAAALTDVDMLTEAEQALTDAVDIMRDSGEDLSATDIDLVHAEIEIRRGHWMAATDRLERSLRFLEAQADWAGAADVLRALGDLATRRNQPQDAITPLRRSLSIWRRLRVPLEVARVLARLDQALTATHQPDLAAQCRRDYHTILTDLRLNEASLRLPTN